LVAAEPATNPHIYLTPPISQFTALPIYRS
jgi:hypothetical protein